MKLTLRRHVFDDPADAFDAGRMGMLLLLAALGVLFVASILGYLILRLEAADLLDDLPALPSGLWVSTLIILLCSAGMHGALVAARRGAGTALRGALGATMLLGAAFLGMQGWCWLELMAQHEAVWAQLQDVPRYMVASFYVMTALHAAHVLGGLIPLAVVTWFAFRGAYGPTRHEGVYYCAMYWHFLDGVWLALFVTLLLGS